MPAEKSAAKRPTRRPKPCRIWLSDAELETLRGRARLVRRPLARYVREAALNALPAVPPGRLDAELIRQLARVGNNLNQLAREANAARAYPSAQRIEAALAEFHALGVRLSGVAPPPAFPDADEAERSAP